MADELNIPTHRWYQPRYNISLPNTDFSKQWIFNSGIQKIDAFINGGSFSPSTLFALAEPGVWFDPSDLSTLFQDPAGTTAVTAPGNTVGLMLDKSKGLALGAELVANGTFDTNTNNWTAINSTLSVDANRLKVLSSATYGWAYQAFTTVVGRTYRLSYSLTNGDAIGCYMYVDPAAGNAGANYNSGLPKADGTYTVVFVATATTTYVKPLIDGLGKFAFYDNISVRELAGNHATQATIAARPTYSIEPVGGRRNLLTFSEQFDNAAWNAGGNRMLQVTANAATAPDGTTTADKVFEAASGAGSVTHNVIALGAIPAGVNTLSVYAKKAERKRIFLFVNGLNQGAWFDLDTGAFAADGSGATAAIQNVGNGWYRCSLTTTPATAGTFYLQMAVIRDSATTFDARVGDGTSGVFLWGAQFETGSTPTAYQRVTTQHDVTEAGVASLGYLYFDGVNDAMVTSTITPGIDKAQVFAGVRKLSSALSVLAELSVDADTNNGTLHAYSETNLYAFRSRGTGTSQASYTNASVAAPFSSVFTGIGDISGDIAELRLNGTQVAISASNQGTGDFLAYPLYIGARAGTARFLLGHLYSLITRFGPTLDAPTISNTEIWVGDKTGIDVAKNISTTIYTRSGDTILDRANSTIERRAV